MRVWIAAAALAALPIMAQADSVLQACEADIATHCARVEPGHGRLTACLYAHEDKLSETCDAATAEMGDVLDLFFSRVREIGIACGEDVQTHCDGVSIGGGRVMACLRENQAKVSQACGDVLTSMPQPEG